MDMACIPLDSDVVAKIKNFSGGNPIEGDVKFMHAFSYVYSGHLLFGSNYPIKITYIDEAFAERILLIPCDYKVPIENRDPDLLDKIRYELPVIATKAAYTFYSVRKNKYVFTGDDIWKVSAADLCSSISDINEKIVFKFLNLCCEVTNSHEDYIIIGELFKMFCVLLLNTQNRTGLLTITYVIMQSCPKSTDTSRKYLPLMKSTCSLNTASITDTVLKLSLRSPSD